jgi:hypothetical protein
MRGGWQETIQGFECIFPFSGVLPAAPKQICAWSPSIPIQDPSVSHPHVQGVAAVLEVEEPLLLFVEPKPVQCFRPRLALKAVHTLTVQTNDVTEVDSAGTRRGAVVGRAYFLALRPGQHSPAQ